jgi:tetratricopeptide (TPR) repeat protein
VKFHPSDMTLEELYLCQGEEHQTLLTHLVSCSRCSLRFLGVIQRAGEGDTSDWEGAIGATCYDEVLDHTDSPTARRELAIARERATAPGLFVEVMRLAPEQQRLLIRNSPRFRTWGLCELLLERSLEMAIQNPMGAEALALLALEVSAHLDSSSNRAGLIHDLQARAWSYLGNARRVKADHQGAEEAFSKSESLLRKGSRDPVEFAMFLSLKASLRRAQRRFEDALKLLQRAVVIFRRNGHAHRAGKSLVTMDTIYCYAGHPERGIPLLYQAIKLIDADREPRLRLCAHHNLIHDLTETGRFLEAQKLYRKSRSLYRDFPDAVTRSRRRWVKGKISSGLGKIVQAERLLLAARDGFIAEGISYDTALVSLELAALYAREGRTTDLKRLAREMFPIFSSLQVHREALAALSFLQQALDAEQAGIELVARVADFLRRAEHDPGLRFEP